MNALLDLIRLMPPPTVPVEAPTADDWLALRERRGIAFPADYQAFLAAYGTGVVANFLWVLSPFARNRHLNIIEQADRQLDAEREFARLVGGTTPYPLAPDPEGLYPWAITDNGDILHWLRRGEPARWTVVARHSRASEWEEFPLTMARFLFGYLRRDLVVRAFPDDATSDSPTFTPVPANGLDRLGSSPDQ